MTHDDDRVDTTVDDAAPDPTPVEPPTVLQRARALWCQLVSGLG
ncbi:MAG: hypothetical protein U0R68_03535 [Candidatus Nanopelagicales bacterium]